MLEVLSAAHPEVALDPDPELIELLARWFEQGDALAHRKAYSLLVDALYVPPETRRVLGASDTDKDLKQEVLARLLDAKSGKLRGVTAPLAYARTALRRECVSQIRKWGPRAARAAEVTQHIEVQAPVPETERVEMSIDAQRAIAIAERLSGKGRLAVLLTTRPDRITDQQWSALVADLPPPPPSRPRDPIDREEASAMLFPPSPSETSSEHNQRLNSFDKAYKRALAVIRRELGVDR